MRCYQKQQGVALLVMVLFLLGVVGIIGEGYLNNTLKEIERKKQNDTRVSLEKAKQALLQYAFNYPDISPSNAGAGRLPCPDTDDDGQAQNTPQCSSGAGQTMVGRFPYLETGLDIEDLKDGSNTRLWYATSRTFSWIPPTIINANTLGEMSLSDSAGNILYDASADNGGIVAVIIAPGQSITRHETDGSEYEQIRIIKGASDPGGERLKAENYLDVAHTIDNAIFEYGDTDTSTGIDDVDGFIVGPVFDSVSNSNIVNDQFITITRQEIIEFALKRVMVEIPIILADYKAKTGNEYPWLYDANYADNGTFDFTKPVDPLIPLVLKNVDELDFYGALAQLDRGDPTDLAGNPSHAAVLRTTEIGFIPMIDNEMVFGTKIKIDWNLAGTLPNPPVSSNSFTLISEAELRNIPYAVSGYLGDICTWNGDDAGQIECSILSTTPITLWQYDWFGTWKDCPANTKASCPISGLPLQVRSYEIFLSSGINLKDGAVPTTVPTYGAATTATNAEIEMQYEDGDVGDLISNANDYFRPRLVVNQYFNKLSATPLETATLDLSTGSYISDPSDVIDITVEYFPEGGWVAKNGWNQNVLMEYTEDYKPGGGLTDCTTAAPPSCLTVQTNKLSSTIIDAILIGSNAPQSNSTNWPSSSMADYFEGEQVTDNQIYDTKPISINDLIKVLKP